MNLSIKRDKIPFEFVLKTVTVGMSLGFGFLCLLFIALSAFFSLFVGVTEFLASFNIGVLILPLFLVMQGFAYALITSLGIAVYSKFKKVNVTIEG